jgi:ribosomal protein S18 acetylase RimI-like enzyme
VSSPRRLTARDLEAVESWAEAAPPATGALAPLEPMEDAYGVEQDGALMAVLRGRRVLDEAELHVLWTCPSARRRGWGRGLLGWWLSQLRGEGIRRVFLEVRSDGTAAAALYADLGFVELGRRRGYYGDVDARVFVLEVQPNVEAAQACEEGAEPS